MSNPRAPKSKLTPRNVALGAMGAFVGGLSIWVKANSEDVVRDIRFIYRAGKTRRWLESLQNKEISGADFFRDALKRQPNREAVRFVNNDDTTQSYTYAQVDEFSNQIANWAINSGLKRGDVVAMMMDNKPEVIFTFVAFMKIGVALSMVNSHLKGHPLLHSFAVCNPSRFIIGTEFVDTIKEMQQFPDAHKLKGDWYTFGGGSKDFIPLEPILVHQSRHLPCQAYPKDRSVKDTLCYIYTSGTTGLPKASVVKHIRLFIAGEAFSQVFSYEDNERFYMPLPLYHSSGLLIGLGSAWRNAGCVIFRRKFSASKYFEDCQKHDCTIGVYIGELCRYLLAQPERPTDKTHKLKLMVGNGMRPEVWEPFAARFNVPRIGEFYASTEGNVALWNTLGETGAVGYVPPLVRMLSPYTIVKYDVDKDELVRDAKGFAVKCNYDEPGELLALIAPGEITRDFGGYTDQAASQKKIMHNVLKSGDCYFRTGDLVRLSKRGFFYFHDRIGDTFRWKGENVSTSEVEQVLNTIPGVNEATVYGVQVPHCEGRAGMAYLVADPSSFNWDTYQQRVAKELPRYAAPIFVRFGKAVETTATFKHKKTNMMRDGFNPALVSDPLFVRDDAHKRFVPLTKEVYEKICTQNLFAKL